MSIASREDRRHELTLASVRDPVQHQRVHVEPEARRLHDPTVARWVAPDARNQCGLPRPVTGAALEHGFKRAS
jgi:hypothetical protein